MLSNNPIRKEEEENPFTLPELEFAVNKETVDDTIAYKLDYSLGFNIQDQMAYNAANLDGGQSTSLVINNELVNSPNYLAKKQGGRYVVTGWGLIK